MSRRIMVVLAVFVLLAMISIVPLTGLSEKTYGEEQHKYIGVKKCGKCHKSKKKGNQLGAWEAGEHSKAFEHLASEEAKKIAKELGIEDPQKDAKCLKCHLTEHGVDEALLAETYEKEKGVQCETCHGAGSDYYKMKTMKDRDKAIAGGLLIPDGKMCRKCHNEESPTFKDFCFKLYYDKVSHPNPKKENTREVECDCNKDDAGKCKDACKDKCNA